VGQPTKGTADYYKEGDWNVSCSMCGRKLKASEAVKNWQGMYRHPWHDEPRQPQDFARGVKDLIAVPFSQPETDNQLLVCSLNRQSGVPGFGMPGCMIPGNTYFDINTI
jgi:hypothetical protein